MATSMTKPSTRFTALALSAVLLCAGAPLAYAAIDQGPHRPGTSTAPHPAGAPSIETNLLFGTARPDGGPAVTEEQLRSFVDEVVTPRFPTGLTVRDGYGQYRDRHGVIERERSYELTLLYPRSQAHSNNPKIEQIREAYTKRFSQESVARVDDRARVDF